MTRFKWQQVVVALVLILTSAALTYWIQATIEIHEQWTLELNGMINVRTHLDEASFLLKSNGWDTNATSQFWMNSELKYAYSDLLYWSTKDTSHSPQLGTIESSIEGLSGFIGAIIALNSTQRTTLAGLLHNLGWNLTTAYGEPIGYKSNIAVLYFGGQPPDEGALLQAVNIAKSLHNYA